MLTPWNIEAGEEVRWLPRRRASTIALPGNDFWLIDRHTVVWNHFTGAGDWAANEVTTGQYRERDDQQGRDHHPGERWSRPGPPWLVTQPTILVAPTHGPMARSARAVRRPG